MLHNNIHIIVGSRLKEYGGGIETWLDYFLYHLLQTNTNVLIYYVESTGGNLLDKFKDKSNITQYRSSVEKSKVKSITFVKETLACLKENIKDGDICLLIGSIIAGALVVPLRLKYKKTIKICLWLRELALNANTKGKKKLIYPVLYLEEKINMKLADKIFTNGYDTYEYYKQRNKKIIDKFSVIPNAVDYKKYSNLEEAISPNCFKIVYIARLIKERFFGVCEAMSLFYKKYPEYRDKVICDVWGEGNYIPSELPPNIIMKGFAKREMIPNILQEANLYFNLLEEESKKISGGGLSHSLLEAMACGKLCISTNHPAARQITDETNGIITEPFNYEQIADTIFEIAKAYFANDYEKYKSISKNARLTAEKYSCEAHMQNFYKNMQELGYIFKLHSN